MGKHHCIWVILAFVLIILITLIPVQPPTYAQTRDTSHQAFMDNLNTFDSLLWYKADGWSNGGLFDCGWEADNVSFESGIMSLQLDNNVPANSGWNYVSGEYRSNGYYQYGTYTVRMKAIAQEGVVSSFFIYTDEWDDGNPWDEIDIEITGNHTDILHTNYYNAGEGQNGEHEANIPLGFDASAAFHTYSIEWMPDSIKWYVDGDLIHTEDGSKGPLPTTPGRIMMNFWPGTDSVNDWLGDFVYSAPLTAQYDWVSFEPVDWPNDSFIPLVMR